MENKNIKRINTRYFKILAIVLGGIWLISFILRYTSLMQNYYINFFTLLVVENTINIFLVMIPMIILYILDKKRIRNENERLEGSDKE